MVHIPQRVHFYYYNFPISDPPELTQEQFPHPRDIKTTEMNESQAKPLLDSVDVLLMVVTKKELRAVLGLMEPICEMQKIVEVTSNNVTFLIGTFGKYCSAIIQTSQGIQGFDGAEKKTARAIDVVKPYAVISVGIAYGKSKEKQQLADVLVCEQVSDYTHKRLGEITLIRSPQPKATKHLQELSWLGKGQAKR